MRCASDAMPLRAEHIKGETASNAPVTPLLPISRVCLLRAMRMLLHSTWRHGATSRARYETKSTVLLRRDIAFVVQRKEEGGYAPSASAACPFDVMLAAHQMFIPRGHFHATLPYSSFRVLFFTISPFLFCFFFSRMYYIFLSAFISFRSFVLHPTIPLSLLTPAFVLLMIRHAARRLSPPTRPGEEQHPRRYPDVRR